LRARWNGGIPQLLVDLTIPSSLIWAYYLLILGRKPIHGRFVTLLDISGA